MAQQHTPAPGPEGKTRAARAERHEWLRDLLKHRDDARKLVRRFAL